MIGTEQVIERPKEHQQLATRIFFPNLDGIRFFCFLSVFFSHSFGSTKYAEVSQTQLYWLLKKFLFENGVLGVNFFYVLSGFLITYLLIIEKENFIKIKIRNFYVRRALRIWPLYFFCVFFGFFIFPLFKEFFGEVPNETASLGYYLFFVNNLDTVFHGPPDSSVLAILWSVAIEEQFYLFWPLILSLFSKRIYFIIFSVLIVLSFAFRMAHADNYYALNVHTFSCISDMVVGGVFALSAIYIKAFIGYIKNAPRTLWIALYIVVAIMYVFIKDIFHHTAFLFALERFVISILFALIICEQCFADNSFYKMSKFKTISRLGTYTFGLYCLHPIGFLIANKGLGYFNLNKNIYSITFFETPLAFVLTVAMAYLSYHFYEKRFLLYKEKFARIRKF